MACRLDCFIHIDTKILFNVGCVLMTFKSAIVSCFYNNRLNFMLLKVYLLFLSYFHWYGMCEFMEKECQLRPPLKLGRELDVPVGPRVQHSGSLLNAFPVVSYFYNRIHSLKTQNLSIYINSFGMSQNFIERKGSLIFKSIY